MTQSSDWRHGEFRRPAFLYSLLAVVLVAVLHGAIGVQRHAVEEMDSPEWLRMALNTAVHGVVSTADHLQSNPAPSMGRPPLFAFVAGLAIKAGSEPDKHSLVCIKEQIDPSCRAEVRSAQLLNLALFAALAGVTAVLGTLMGGVRLGLLGGLLVAGNTFFASSVAVVAPEILSPLLLTLAVALLAACYRRPGIWWLWLLAGAALGALTLVKPVFTYAVPIVCLVGFLASRAWRPSGWRPVLLRASAAMIIAVSIPAAWMVRNAVVLDQREFTVDKKGETVLATRAAYTTMEWREVLPALVSLTPTVGEPLLRILFDPDDIKRVLNVPGKTRDAFYVDRKKIVIDAALKLDPALAEASQMRRAIAVITANLDKHIALVPVFLYSGMYPRTGSGTYAKLTEGVLVSPLVKLMIGSTILLSTLGMVAILAVPLLALMKRVDTTWLVVAALPLYSMAFHAGLTHYIGRYSNPLVPVGYVLVGTALIHIFKWVGGRSKRQPSPA